jgi:hypothetical protein
MTLIQFSIISAVLLFQVLTSVRLARTSQYTLEQKILQALLIWLLPIVGALIVYAVLGSEDTSPAKRDSNFVPQKDLSLTELTSLSDTADR